MNKAMKKAKVSGEKIEVAKKLLKDLKPVPVAEKEFSKLAAINAIKKEILAAKKAGHTYKDIAATLAKEWDIELTEGTLKSYMGRSKEKKSTAAPKKAATAAPEKEAKVDGDDKQA